MTGGPPHAGPRPPVLDQRSARLSVGAELVDRTGGGERLGQLDLDAIGLRASRQPAPNTGRSPIDRAGSTDRLASTAVHLPPDAPVWRPGPTSSTEPIPGAGFVPVDRPVLRMRWAELTYLHWDLDPDVVAARLPPGLEPDVHAGRAYVGLIPFRMARIGLGPRGVPLPHGSFPETNVRTYVVGPDGGRGVFFHSLDVTRLAPAAVARTTYRLPYCWSRMGIAWRGARVVYRAWRRWPGPRGVGSHVVVEVGACLAPSARTPLDEFLSARWSLYEALPGGAIVRARVDHEPWPLREARLVHLADDFVRAAGYPAPLGTPSHVRYGGDVDVRVGPPRRVA